MSFTPYERETRILMNNEDDTANIWTAQRPWITALKKNPAATLLKEGKHGSSAWAVFEIPVGLIPKPRTKRRQVSLTPEERKERGARLRKVAVAA